MINQYLIEKNGYKYDVHYSGKKKKEEDTKCHFFHKTMELKPFKKPRRKVKIIEKFDYSSEARSIIKELKKEVAAEMNDNPRSIRFRIIKEKEEKAEEAPKIALKSFAETFREAA
jgi:hypothetical protein